jgi:hypothetical protein
MNGGKCRLAGRTTTIAVTIAIWAISLVSLDTTARAEEALIGPLVGHVDASSAMLWARLPEAGKYRATVTPEGDATGDASSATVTAEANSASDFTAQWRFASLQPQTRY